MYPTQKSRQNIRTKVHFEDPWAWAFRSTLCHKTVLLVAWARSLRPDDAFPVTVSRCVDDTGRSSRIAKLRAEMGVNPVSKANMPTYRKWNVTLAKAT